jgi:hypothetical protein
MLLSDWIGAVASGLLVVAPGRDVIARWSRDRLRARTGTEVSKFWKRLAEVKEEDRNAFSWLDTLTLSGGALLLLISFIAKLAGR